MNENFIPEREIQEWAKKITPLKLDNASDLVNKEDSVVFLRYWYENMFVVQFDWENWEEGIEFLKQKEWFSIYDLDVEFCYKLLTAIIRADRFSEGLLQHYIEEGVLSSILTRLFDLKEEENSLNYRYSSKPRKCPVCGSTKIAEIVYGLPNFESVRDDLDSGKIFLGGCCVNLDGSDPKWKCADCWTNLFRTVETEI